MPSRSLGQHHRRGCAGRDCSCGYPQRWLWPNCHSRRTDVLLCDRWSAARCPDNCLPHPSSKAHSDAPEPTPDRPPRGGRKTEIEKLMSSKIMHQILQIIEEEMNSRPSAIEFEMAYQARIAIDRLRFAIKYTEQFCTRSDQLREVGLQLLDALERLETVDRRFQERSRKGVGNQRAG